MKCFTIVLLVCAVAAVACRSTDDDDKKPGELALPIRLKSRVFEPKRGIDPALETAIRNAQGGRIHVIVQFETIPGLAARQSIAKELEIRVLDTIPERSFFVGMPADMRTAKTLLATNPRAVYVGPIEARDKLSATLAAGKVPETTRREKGLVEVITLFFSDVDREAQQKLLRDAGAQQLERIGPVNGWQFLLDERRILGLGRHDIVKWVEAGPPPVEEDNDGVRSPTGVDADAVLAPGVYGLSGAGVTVAHWESTNASLQHGDFVGQIVLGDGPIPVRTRSEVHDETVSANNQFDAGEAVYVDMDDSANVSAGDVRSTAVPGFGAGTVVAGGNADVGNALAFFRTLERFPDNNPDLAYTAGEPVYLDAAGFGAVSVGDTRITAAAGFAAGSVVALGDVDFGTAIFNFRTNPHYHSTHVAGTVIGSGAQSVANGGSANQWKGVAPGATLRSYRTDGLIGFSAEYANAIANGATISTNSWGISHHHQVVAPNAYGVWSSLYDSIVSGRQSDGSPSGLAQRVLVLGSSGNQGIPVRHTENISVNGQFDNGESIIFDTDDSGTFSAPDFVLGGPTPLIGPALVNFNLNEKHDETGTTAGRFNNGEGIYRDGDGTGTVTATDTRINGAAGFAAGSVVVAGNADIGVFLRPFKLWGNVRIPNAAKDTVVVANVRSDTMGLSPSSSRGPTEDGRIKPDVAGPGSQAGGDQSVKSTWPRNTYDGISGTSMSTPAVSGCAALLTEWYVQSCLATGPPSPATLRALLLHGAEDLVTIPQVGAGFTGPDYAFGYGRVRVPESLALIPHHRTGNFTVTGTQTFDVTVGAMGELKVTMAWDDPAWTANSAPSAITGILQNDLDLVLIAPDGTQYTPWVLNPASPGTPATSSTIASGGAIPAAARDRLNPVEQVLVQGAMAGTWTVQVTASTLNQPPQGYVVVSETIRPQDSPCAGLTPVDVWMKDNPADPGPAPSTGRLWLSPDIWNSLAAAGSTTHDNPEFGQTNYLYANVRNASTTSVAGATNVEVWLGGASTGLGWPDDFSLVGRFVVPNLGAGEVRQVGPLAWDPPPPSPSDHFCFYVRVVSPQDPITFAETSSVSTNTQQSNNIVWRNVNVVDLLSSKSVTFVVRNTLEKEALIDLVLEIPDTFLRVGQAHLALDAKTDREWLRGRELPGGLEADRRVAPYPWTETKALPKTVYGLVGPKIELRGLALKGREQRTVTLVFGSDQKTQATYDVHVTQRINGETMGGILYQVRTGHGNQ